MQQQNQQQVSFQVKLNLRKLLQVPFLLENLKKIQSKFQGQLKKLLIVTLIWRIFLTIDTCDECVEAIDILESALEIELDAGDYNFRTVEDFLKKGDLQDELEEEQIEAVAETENSKFSLEFLRPYFESQGTKTFFFKQDPSQEQVIVSKISDESNREESGVLNPEEEEEEISLAQEKTIEDRENAEVKIEKSLVTEETIDSIQA